MATTKSTTPRTNRDAVSNPASTSTGRVFAGLRHRIETIDAQLVMLLARRVLLTQRIADHKRTTDQPPIDPAREQQILERARSQARELDMAEDTAAAFLQTAIRLSYAERCLRESRGAPSASGSTTKRSRDSGSDDRT